MALHDVDDLGKGLVLCDMKVDNALFVWFPIFVMQGRCLGLPGPPERVRGVGVACCRNIQRLAFWKKANNTWVECSSSGFGIEEGILVNRTQLIHLWRGGSVLARKQFDLMNIEVASTIGHAVRAHCQFNLVGAAGGDVLGLIGLTKLQCDGSR